MASNLYVHFPFCRRKCTYCALHSRCGSTQSERDAYVRRLAASLAELPGPLRFRTVYFGGGSPALCSLGPLLDLIESDEFTVELHPMDVCDRLLKELRDGGVNRISMGVQSLDDTTLAAMGRAYTVDQAERAFAGIREVFDNAGIDLIAGYPVEGSSPATAPQRLARLRGWGLAHCSVYSLQQEPDSILGRRISRARKERDDSFLSLLKTDDQILDEIREAAAFLESIGLRRYEISNYAVPGRECLHNLAVWRGEDYLGLGEGASGRVGLFRTHGMISLSELHRPDSPCVEKVDPEYDSVERAIFRLRTREGIDVADRPQWRTALERFAAEGLVVRSGDSSYRLSARGTEVCDSILAELV